MDSNPYSSDSDLDPINDATRPRHSTAKWLLIATATVGLLFAAAISIDSIPGGTAERISVSLFRITHYACRALLCLAIAALIWGIAHARFTWWLAFAFICVVGELFVMHVVAELMTRD